MPPNPKLVISKKDKLIQKIESKDNNNHSSIRVVIAALGANFLVTIMKFIGFMFTSSPSMLAESLHSLADTFNQILLYLGITTSQKENKGPLQFIFNFSSAIGVFVLACGLTIAHAISDLINAPAYVLNSNFFNVSIAIMFLALIIEGSTCYMALKEIIARKGNKSLYKFLTESNDTTLIGIFLEDSAAILGILIAMVGMTTSRIMGSNLPDIVASLIIGAMMGSIAITLILNNTKLLMGKSLSEEREDEIKELLNSQPLVERIEELKTEIIGHNKVHLYCKIEFNGSTLLNNSEVNDYIDEIKQTTEDNESLAPFLIELSDRVVRKLGYRIKELEKEIKKEFPEIVAIDLEVN